MRIAVVGAGGVGGYFGGRLAAAGADVTFLARGTHLDAIKSRGLTIQSFKGDVHLPKVVATDDPHAVGPVDIVLFTVKLYDAEGATAMLPALIGPDTAVIPLQNGVDAANLVSRAVGPAHTAGGTVYIAAVIAEPGVIRHTALGRLVFGELNGSHSTRLQKFLDVCTPAGFDVTLSNSIRVEIWRKFVLLSVFSGMTAVTRCPIGPIAADPDLSEMLRSAVRETMAVAHASGVEVPDNVIGDVDRAYQTLPPQMKSSMLEDLERGKRLELPWLSGAVVRIGREVGVPTPTHQFIATVLKPHVNGSPG